MMKDTKIQFGVMRIGKNLISIDLTYFSEVFHANNEQSLPQRSEFLRGGVELRGQLIPVLEVHAFGQLVPQQPQSQLGVVVEYEDRLIAFFVDEVVGITNISSDQIQNLLPKDATKDRFFETGFAHENGFANVLNVKEIMRLPGLITAEKTDAVEKRSAQSLEPVLTFEAGGALYCLPAVEIYAAIPKRDIQHSAITFGPCLGEITYHGRRIPVICPVQTFGLGDKRGDRPSEIVALRFPGDLVLGLAVDAIHQIGTIETTHEAALPIWISGQNFIKSVNIRPDSSQLYVLDLVTIHAASALCDIASLSRSEEPEASTTKHNVTDNDGIIHDRERYIIVAAPDRISIPLSQVNRILPMPTDITVPQKSVAGFRGYFTAFKQSIALFDLPECLGHQSNAPDDRKVLLTGEKGKMIGFIVDAILGIEVSEWHENQIDESDANRTLLAQIGRGDKAQVLPICYLDKILKRWEVSALSPHPPLLLASAE